MVRLSPWQWGPGPCLSLQLQPRAPRHEDDKGDGHALEANFLRRIVLVAEAEAAVIVRGLITVQKSHSLTCRFEFLQRAATAAFPAILGPPSPTGTFQFLLLLFCALVLPLAGEDGLLLLLLVVVGLESRVIPV